MTACVFPKVSWCLRKTESCEKEYLQSFKTTWYCILTFCDKMLIHRPYDKIVFIYLSIYLFINLFAYLLISHLTHHFFSSLRINQCHQLVIYLLLMSCFCLLKIIRFTLITLSSEETHLRQINMSKL